MAWIAPSLVKGFPWRVRRYLSKTPWHPKRGGVHVCMAKTREQAETIRDMLNDNRIFIDRTKGVGVLSKEDAISFGVTGPLSRDITTAYPDAQAYFNQGLQMMYAFTIPNAVESFEEAQRQDPDCAMCFFGEAWARGPFLNGRMRPSNAPRAYEAIQTAIVLAEESGTPSERALINAMAIRYTEEEDADRRPQLDSMYSRAMAEIYQDFPDDLDVGTLYAESLILLDPVRANYRLGDLSVQRFHRVLEAVLAKDINHPYSDDVECGGCTCNEDQSSDGITDLAVGAEGDDAGGSRRFGLG